MNALIKKPSRQEQRTASESLRRLNAATQNNKSTQVKIQVEESGELISIPPKALDVLATILSHMAEGKATSVVAADAELSTQQAAELLGASRPHIVKLLEEGTIPFKKVGSHRRVLLEDILKYQTELRLKRKERLKFLAKQAQELGLGYQ
ncbi:excisionase family DNA-binding protein [Persicitalea sp.]|uniref:excisionase family DNA-binding protein n=1 Tax=Persicitalea sp. TaxID=3100273 RepID=UPI00359492B4